MSILERDPFVSKEKLEFSDGKVDFSIIKQLKRLIPIIENNTTPQKTVVIITPGLHTIAQVSNHNGTVTIGDIEGFSTNTVVPFPVCKSQQQGTDDFVIELDSSIYWRLLSVGVRILVYGSDLTTEGYMETFDEPMTTYYGTGSNDNNLVFRQPVEKYNNNDVDKFNKEPHYEVMSLEGLDKEEFILSKINTHHDFIHIPKTIASSADYRGNARLLTISDRNKIVPYFFDFNFRTKIFRFDIPANQKIKMELVFNYEYFLVDAEHQDNNLVEPRIQNPHPLGAVPANLVEPLTPDTPASKTSTKKRSSSTKKKESTKAKKVLFDLDDAVNTPLPEDDDDSIDVILKNMDMKMNEIDKAIIDLDETKHVWDDDPGANLMIDNYTHGDDEAKEHVMQTLDDLPGSKELKDVRDDISYVVEKIKEQYEKKRIVDDVVDIERSRGKRVKSRHIDPFSRSPRSPHRFSYGNNNRHNRYL